MPKVSVELNFYYLHYNDAKAFADWADRECSDVHPSIFARHAIVSTVFAGEALINRVLTDFGDDPGIFEVLEKAGILDKWYLAPFLCAGQESPSAFVRGSEPFQSFKELVQIRNWLAHPKIDNFLDADLDPRSTISDGDSGEEYPWLEMLKGQAWPQTRIPRNPFAMSASDARTALRVLDEMTAALQSKLQGRMTDTWLNLITVKDAAGVHNYRAPVHTIWGGYGGVGS